MGVIGYRVVNGKKEYCLYDSEKKTDVVCGHPAKFSPEDGFSQYRIDLKTKHNLIPQPVEE
ncbi:H/ACA ribonucleoprotein complex subunit 3 [Nematocida sp. AWRm80]|nr:H/ACA ribonucleoprotein complex subunit 3 [Nematocida sp. AWRm80]